MAEQKQYTKPQLREKLKEEIKQGSKGGKPGQWSARKAQLLVTEYEKQGGGYKSGGRKGDQKHLKQWENEEWTTADGKKAQKSDGSVDRYLPKKAWEKMTPAEKQRTRQRKQQTSKRSGQQYVANTGPAKQARRTATKSRTNTKTASKTNSTTSASKSTTSNKTPSELSQCPVREVLAGMRNYDKRQLQSLRKQEEKRSNRSTVITAIDKRLA